MPAECVARERDAASREMLPAPARRAYPVIVFDWDGTAVPDRQSDASRVAELLCQLLREGVAVAIVSGTSFPNVDGQLGRDRDCFRRPGLFLLTNRGSEVYSYDPDWSPRLIARRQATPEEDAALTATAANVARELSDRHGLETRIVPNRLNRRKIDLIPLPEWSDPPKSRIDELEAATSARLHEHGLPGGIADVAALIQTLALSQGLQEPRVTSDAKYAEVGLTDKGDSLDWVLQNLIVAARLAPADLLVLGDEFGPVAGLPGSDSRMIVPAAAGATFVSVGREPRGVPADVLLVPGGPAAFAAILGEQLTLHSQTAPDARRT